MVGLSWPVPFRKSFVACEKFPPDDGWRHGRWSRRTCCQAEQMTRPHLQFPLIEFTEYVVRGQGYS